MIQNGTNLEFRQTLIAVDQRSHAWLLEERMWGRVEGRGDAILLLSTRTKNSFQKKVTLEAYK